MEARRLAGSLALFAAASAGCTTRHDVALEISTAGLAGASASSWAVRVYRGGSCPSVDAVALEDDGAFERVYATSFAAGEAPPAVGRLEAGLFAFAALARGTGCRPVGFGCVVADVSASDVVRVEVQPSRWESSELCGAGLACADGRCVGRQCDPTSCTTDGAGGACCGPVCVDLASDPAHCGTCERTCGASQRCTGGECREAITGCETLPSCPGGLACCRDACVDTLGDPLNCGMCGHACPMGLSCTRGVCRSLDPSREIVVYAGADATVRCEGLVVAAVWPVVGAGGEAVLETGALAPVDLSSSDRGVLLSPISGPSDAGACGTAGCDLGIAFGALVLARDVDGDRRVSRAELFAAPMGVSDVGLAWSEVDLPPTDARVVRLREVTGAWFPEGLLAGVAAYRSDAAGMAGWVPLPPGDGAFLRTCGDCTGAPIDDMCVASLPWPFGLRP